METTAPQQEALSTEAIKRHLSAWNNGALMRMGLFIGWSLMHRVFLTLAKWRQRNRQRKHLLALDSRILKDIGLSHADVYKESKKPFWRG